MLFNTLFYVFYAEGPSAIILTAESEARDTTSDN